eukprot:Skav219033  [mRNA]  locus=scaffold511:67006:69218:+ [translate_table: standard]
MAALRGHCEAVDVLLGNPSAWLHRRDIRELLANSAPVEAQDKEDEVPVGRSVGSLRAVGTVVDGWSHVTPDAACAQETFIGDVEGETPLHLAACEGHSAVVQLLLAARAPLEAKNRQGDVHI